ncbi:MAG TPA: hypothetical protein PKM60_09295 [Zoogloea sp.]|nr:hypothetical protein [Zoogloea sp.]
MKGPVAVAQASADGKGDAGVANGAVAAAHEPTGLKEGIVVFGVLLALALVLHFPHYGSHYGDPNFDIYLHYQWVKEFAEGVRHGWLYPRWAFFSHFGLGEPVFVFYSPLYYLLSALLSLTGIGTWNAMHVVEVLTNALFGFFIYLTCRSYTSFRVALLAGFAAAANPFLMMLHYKFQGFAWASVGYAAHGLLLWSLFRPRASFDRLNLPAAAAIGIAVVGHTMSTLVILICYSAAALVAPGASGRVTIGGLPRRLLAWTGTVALGLGLGAIYLLPALGSTSLINTAAWTGPHILQGFVWPTFSAVRHGVQWFSFQWPLALPVLALLLAQGWLFFRLKAAEGQPVRPVLIRLFLVLGVAVFFGSELSYPLWTVESPLLRIQLPYRFLSVAYVMVIVIGALLIEATQASGRSGWRRGMAFAIAAVGVLGLFIAGKSNYLDGGPLVPAMANDQYTFELLPQWSRTPDGGFACSAETRACRFLPLSAGSFRGTPEYETKLLKPAYIDYAVGGFAQECRSHQAHCGPARYVANTVAWSIDMSSDGSLRLPVFLWPNWSVQVDGGVEPAVHDPDTGLILVRLGTGTHEVRLEWVDTPMFAVARWVSIISLVLWGCLALAAKRRVRAGWV